MPIRLVTLDGKETRGEIFLQAAAYQADGLETIGGKLGAEGAHFMAFGDGTRVEQVGLHWIAYVEVAGLPGEVTTLEEIGACRAAVALELVTGETLRGDLLYLLPPGSSNVADLLNDPAARFLVLVDGDRTRYVQRRALTRVTPEGP